MALRTKPTVRFKRFTPAIMTLLNTLYACDLGKLVGQPEDLVITSANDSQHGPQSRHGKDEALDLRSKTFADETAKNLFRAHLARQLGPRFTVLYEAPGTEKQHFHCQPKKGTTYP